MARRRGTAAQPVAAACALLEGTYMSALVLYEPYDPRVEDIWRRLEATASPAYFLSWGWIENWLACLPRDEAPPLAVVHDADGAPAAAFFLGQRRVRRHGLVESSALFFNTTGDPRCDDVVIEHNGLLRSRASTVSLETVLDALPDGWDELFMPAIDLTAFPELGKLGAGRTYRLHVDHETVAPYVDLDLVRAVDGDYLAVLPPATRTLLSRARSEIGELSVEVATDPEQALATFDELLRLRAAREQREPEALVDPWLITLHRRLISTRLLHGEIQLVRVRTPRQTVGCLYNFSYRSRTLFYQAGFSEFADPHIKPGYLCHAAAVEHNASIGMSVYDLLGGDAAYKHCLATGETRLAWVRVQRRLARFEIETQLRRWKDALSSWRQRWTVAVPSRA